jgi:CheY-like chemotaxis protein
MRKPLDFQSERPTSGNYKFDIVEEGTLTGSNGKSTEIERSKQRADRIDSGGGQNAPLLVTPGQGPAEIAPLTFSPVVSPENELAPLKVLVIEDHEDTAILMTQMLNEMGHSIVKADSVASAVEILIRDKIDLIISDIGLPDGNGVSLIYAVRQFCDIPAIAITGYGTREDVERCLNAGFDKHITKPVVYELLGQTIAEVSGDRAPKQTGAQ